MTDKGVVITPREFHTDEVIKRKKYIEHLKAASGSGLILTDIIKSSVKISTKTSKSNALAKDGIINKRKQVEGVDGMTNITEREFEQFEKRIDDKLSSIESKIDSIPDALDTKIELQFEKMKNTQIKWFIGIILTILGIAGRVFGLY